MATLRNNKKLAVFSRQDPENIKNALSQNGLDPETAQEYISQVFEEIEGRVTKKLSKEINKTESRFLGALSRLDEVLLNGQVGTCSITVPGTSRNGDSGNREHNRDRSPNNPCPEAVVCSNRSVILNNSEVEKYPHRCDRIMCEIIQKVAISYFLEVLVET